MPAAAFAAIATSKVVFFCKDNIPFRSFVEITFLEFSCVHLS